MLDNLDIYRKIAGNNNSTKIDSKVYKLINDENFVKQVKSEAESQDPICEMINVFQKKDINVGDGADLWLDLKAPNYISSSQKQKYKKRKEMALTEVALAAFYVDPFKDKQKMTSKQKSEARIFLASKLYGNFKNELLDYESEKPHILKLKEKVRSAKDFWTMAEHALPNLSKIAMKLLKIPASTAQLERIFSMWTHIHTKLRNRLTFENSKKLLTCYHYLTTMDNILLPHENYDKIFDTLDI